MTPRQAYRRVKRVIQHQWRGITIVLIIIADIVFFSIVFVFQDSNMQDAREDLGTAQEWIRCLIDADGDKNECLDKATGLAVSQGTVAAVLFLLAFNGFWLLVLLGKKDMVSAWIDLVKGSFRKRTEFVSVDARLKDNKEQQQRSYEMLSPLSPAAKLNDTPRLSTSLPSSPTRSSRSPDFFKPTLHPLSPPPPSLSQTQTKLSPPPPQHGRQPSGRYQPHARSFSVPRPPQSRDGSEAPSASRHTRDPSASTLGSVSPISSRSGASASRSPQMTSIAWNNQPALRIRPDGYFDQDPPYGASRI